MRARGGEGAASFDRAHQAIPRAVLRRDGAADAMQAARSAALVDDPLSGGRHLVQGSTVWVGFFWQERKTIKSLQHNEQNSFTSTVKSSSDEGGNSNSKAVGGGGGHLGVSVSVDEIGPMLPPVEGFEDAPLSIIHRALVKGVCKRR